MDIHSSYPSQATICLGEEALHAFDVLMTTIPVYILPSIIRNHGMSSDDCHTDDALRKRAKEAYVQHLLLVEAGSKGPSFFNTEFQTKPCFLQYIDDHCFFNDESEPGILEKNLDDIKQYPDPAHPSWLQAKEAGNALMAKGDKLRQVLVLAGAPTSTELLMEEREEAARAYELAAQEYSRALELALPCESAKITLAMALHPRIGESSPLRKLGPDLIRGLTAYIGCDAQPNLPAAVCLSNRAAANLKMSKLYLPPAEKPHAEGGKILQESISALQDSVRSWQICPEYFKGFLRTQEANDQLGHKGETGQNMAREIKLAVESGRVDIGLLRCGVISDVELQPRLDMRAARMWKLIREMDTEARNSGGPHCGVTVALEACLVGRDGSTWLQVSLLLWTAHGVPRRAHQVKGFQFIKWADVKLSDIDFTNVNAQKLGDRLIELVANVVLCERIGVIALHLVMPEMSSVLDLFRVELEPWAGSPTHERPFMEQTGVIQLPIDTPVPIDIPNTAFQHRTEVPVIAVTGAAE
jgi:hypothetical protein